MTAQEELARADTPPRLTDERLDALDHHLATRSHSEEEAWELIAEARRARAAVRARMADDFPDN